MGREGNPQPLSVMGVRNVHRCPHTSRGVHRSMWPLAPHLAPRLSTPRRVPERHIGDTRRPEFQGVLVKIDG